MAKFYGVVGFAETKETKPGVWTEVVTERKYYGDLVRNLTQVQASEYLNDNLNISNSISIMSDDYANQNFFAMKYIVWQNVKWKVKSVEVKPPRLVISIGGVYNEE